MVKIKICGLTREQDIDIVNTVIPDYAGFVFAESKRRIDEKRAKELKKRLDPNIEAVGVFVNEESEKIIRLCSDGIIDLVQLHGDEDENYIRHLRKHIPNKIIKAVRVKDKYDIERAMGFSADFLLFDSYTEGIYGGSGKKFDWSLIASVKKPFFLAGGINTGNALHAVKHLKPYCIDVSSGVETGGCKDPEKVFRLVSMIRQCV